MSDKRRALMPQRRKTCAETMERAGGRCQVRRPGCWGRATDTHEIKSRSAGGSIIDTANTLAACPPCHEWVTNNRIEAEKLGFRVSRYARKGDA